MRHLVRKIYPLLALTLAHLLPCPALASLDSVAPPDDPASAVHKTDDIYNRLQSGAEGAKRSGGFAEPNAGPGDGARKTLDEVMTLAPAPDNLNGATPGNVTLGKSYWGLRTDGSWGPRTGSASPAPVARSGQNSCYDEAGAAMACSATGQDGAKLKGVALPSPRFTNNFNGTVRDNLTGLIWTTTANCPALSGKSWTEALAAVANLKSGECGLNDGSMAGEWRMPNRKELFSLVHDQYSAPALSNSAGSGPWTEGDPFSGVQSDYYWSSTTSVSYRSFAWTLNLNNGFMLDSDKALNQYYVWPVRGGQ